MSSADLHEPDRLNGQTVNFLDDGPGLFAVPVFVDVFHKDSITTESTEFLRQKNFQPRDCIGMGLFILFLAKEVKDNTSGKKIKRTTPKYLCTTQVQTL
jgi:hypothetical protein